MQAQGTDSNSPAFEAAETEIDALVDNPSPSVDGNQENVGDEFVPDEYSIAKVIRIVEEGTTELGGVPQEYQKVEVEIERGKEAGKKVTIAHGFEITLRSYQKVVLNEKVVLLKNVGVDGEANYYIADHYRLPSLLWVVAIFFALVVFFGRWRGFTSIIGIVVSIVVLTTFIIPRILNGGNPLGMSIVGAVIIALISLYVAHGFSRRTSIALASTLITLGLAAGLAMLFVMLGRLSGVGSEEAYYLQFGNLENLNLKGLLLGGIIIGALGVLDDITTGQTAAVEKIHKANPALSRLELVKRGLKVGREHIASLVNTLVLAYAGASFPLLLLFSMNDAVPLWLTFNSEMIAEEVIRTLVGSSALVLAVPIATALAARFVPARKAEKTVDHKE